ncbi:MAG: 1-deoxy-D-xylulose-5-phosphate reductoisomerase, partial [Candidatus Aminicenantes bacterium]|nr:1-deoxy-D-xylulose-5-phosphate reductoisomerase [Candidatus Aminicenantes bacterium]
MENISILGSTGSIGRSTLDVVDKSGGKFNVRGLAAGRNLDLLCRQVEKFKPKIVSLERKEDADKFRRNCKE